MIEKDGFIWYTGRNGSMKKFCSVEEWNIRKQMISTIENTPTLEEKQAELLKVQKELRSMRRKRK